MESELSSLTSGWSLTLILNPISVTQASFNTPKRRYYPFTSHYQDYFFFAS